MNQEPPETLAGNSMVVMNPSVETEFTKIINKSRMADKNGEKRGRGKERLSPEGPSESQDQPILKPENAAMIAIMSAPNVSCLRLEPPYSPLHLSRTQLSRRVKKGCWECESGTTGGLKGASGLVALRMKRPKGGAVPEFTWNQSTGPKDAKSTQHSQGRASEQAGTG